MSRIFVSLSVLPVMLVLTTMGVGWWIGDYNGQYAQIMATDSDVTDPNHDQQVLADLKEIAEPQRRFAIHFQLGLASSLAVVLINSLSVTYLIGTSRWVKEVCEAYGLDDGFHEQSSQLKRKTFPWSIMGVLSILAIVALGAAADPGTLRATTGQWVKPHLVIAVMGTCLIVYAIFVQGVNLQRNADIINRVVDEVRRERQRRGLPVES